MSDNHSHSLWQFIRIWTVRLGNFIRYGLSAVASAVIDEGLFALLTKLLHGFLTGFLFTAVPMAAARLVSSLCNFFINKKLVFKSSEPAGKALLKYYAVAVPNFIAHTLLTYGVFQLLGISEQAVLLRTALHFGVMVALFVATFFIQKCWVFKKAAPDKTEQDGV